MTCVWTPGWTGEFMHCPLVSVCVSVYQQCLSGGITSKCITSGRQGLRGGQHPHTHTRPANTSSLSELHESPCSSLRPHTLAYGHTRCFSLANLLPVFPRPMRPAWFDRHMDLSRYAKLRHRDAKKQDHYALLLSLLVTRGTNHPCLFAKHCVRSEIPHATCSGLFHCCKAIGPVSCFCEEKCG